MLPRRWWTPWLSLSLLPAILVVLVSAGVARIPTDASSAQGCPEALPYRVTAQDTGDQITTAVSIEARGPIHMTGLIVADIEVEIPAAGFKETRFLADSRGPLTTGGRQPRLQFDGAAFPYTLGPQVGMLSNPTGAAYRTGSYALTTTPSSQSLTIRREPGESNLRVSLAVQDGCGTWPPVSLCDAVTSCVGDVIIPTATPVTPTVTATATNTSTSTPTDTPTQTPTNTATPTGTITPTATATNTSTPTPTPTGTITPTATATNSPTQVSIGIGNVTTNLSIYPGGVPLHETLEIAFDAATNATNRFLPYAASYPAGVDQTGVSLDGEFSTDGFTHCSDAEVAAGTATCLRQPGFYSELMAPEQAGCNPLTPGCIPSKGGTDWIVPSGVFRWRVRFAPPTVSPSWQFRIRLQDATGINRSAPAGFATVAAVGSHGFLRVSPADHRYFAFDDGTFFPNISHNMPSTISYTNPSANNALMTTLGADGIQAPRLWAQVYGLWGSSWSQWVNVSGTDGKGTQANEPQSSVVPRTSGSFASYPAVVPPTPPNGGDYFFWLNADEKVFPGGSQFNYRPCRVLGASAGVPKVPVRQGATYRLRVRYNEQQLEGPRLAGGYGLAAKNMTGLQTWHPTDATQRCNYPGWGTTLANTFGVGTTPVDNTIPIDPNPAAQWRILEKTGLSFGTLDSIVLAFALENTKSSDGALADAGHVFIDYAWLEEELPGGGFGPNMIYQPSANPHLGVASERAYALDVLLAQARQANVTLPLNLTEKNDQTMGWLGADGTTGTGNGPDNALFFAAAGTQVRFYQQTWWRYAQARWGSSTAIHSWELLNEGANTAGHVSLATAFAQWMHCGVFGLPDSCTRPPTARIVTTSLDGPNSAGTTPQGFYGNVPLLDFESVHRYRCQVLVPAVTLCPTLNRDNAQFYDTVEEVVAMEAQLGKGAAGWHDKPVVMGEIGWSFSTNASDVIAQGLDDGVHIHQLLWASAASAGGIDSHYWGNSSNIAGTTCCPWYRHVLNTSGALIWDYRGEFALVRQFMSTIPLTNGRWVDAAPAVSNTAGVRALGQKDVTTGTKQAYLWVTNRKHTWCSYIESVKATAVAGCTQTWDGSSLTGTVTLTGFANSTPYSVELWQFTRGTVTTGPTTTSVTSDGSGNVVLNLSTLIDPATADVGIKVGP